MAALIAFLMLAQSVWMPGQLTEVVPDNLDTTVLVLETGTYQIAFGAGCEGFAPDMDVQVNAGSGGVASLADDQGNGQCNVLIGEPLGE